MKEKKSTKKNKLLNSLKHKARHWFIAQAEKAWNTELKESFIITDKAMKTTRKEDNVVQTQWYDGGDDKLYKPKMKRHSIRTSLNSIPYWIRMNKETNKLRLSEGQKKTETGNHGDPSMSSFFVYA